MLSLTPQDSMVPGINTPMLYQMQSPSPVPKTSETTPKDTNNDPPTISASTIKYHPMRKKDAKEKEHVTIVQR